MSLSNILQPNDYNLYCNTINVVNPGIGSLVNIGVNYSLVAANQTIANNVETPIVYDVISTTGITPFTYNITTGLFTCTKNFRISATVQNAFTPFSTVISGASFNAHVKINGTINSGVTNLSPQIVPGGLIATPFNASLNIGDTFQVMATQTTGSPNTLISTSSNPTNFTFFSAVITYSP